MAAINIFWFRRDLRLHDNAGLYHALRSGLPVLPVFIFDTDILDKLDDRDDARVTFLHHTLTALRESLAALGSTLHIYHGSPPTVWAKILRDFDVREVYTNGDAEPYALSRDAQVRELLQAAGTGFQRYKDHVIFSGEEVLKDDGTPYVVFTPYSRRWKAKLNEQLATMTDEAGKEVPVSYFLKPYPNEAYFQHFHQCPPAPMPTLEQMGFVPNERIRIPATTVARGIIRQYDKNRDFPAIVGTTRLGIHFRFGTISIREKALKAQAMNETFLNELIWRDFYAMILHHFPHVAHGAFRPAYDRIEWRNDEQDFERWCAGQTGYPIVDAGMRELRATGYMHNRVRMVVSSFLTKHLLIDWRWGEAWFARKLLDFDLASNNGGWQWAAGSGTDAAPYFRIFNPTAQQAKFDKDLVYVRQWVKEYGTAQYPKPMVDHKLARERCLEVYKAALKP